MRQTNEKVYRCDYCNKAIVSKGFMTYHEKWCKLNPKNIHKCFDYCIHLQREKVLIGYDDNESELYEYKFNCVKLNKPLYSFKLEKKFQKFSNKLTERIQGLNRMPFECNWHSHVNIDDISDSDINF